MKKVLSLPEWAGNGPSCGYHWQAIGDGRGSLLVSHDPPFIRPRLEATVARLAIGRSG